MVKRKTGDKLGDIREATVAEVVECGSSAASINAIAKRAGLSVGTVYRYYENKEQLLRAAYIAIKTDLHDLMMAAVGNARNSKAKIRAMWFAVLDFSYQRPQDFLFAEVIMNETILHPDDKQIIAAMTEQSRTIIVEAIADGHVRAIDVQAIITVLAAPARQLGRAAAFSGKEPDPANAEQVFNLCWHAIEI
ncbi:MAG: TetR/AcrR family transcriptional regulator [Yoonia sp.]|uniref:TetR/AcrR family transcriptional regulator n=1 Tax=Yoonia sp. TaxID=2212373 RepID=UPI00328835AC